MAPSHLPAGKGIQHQKLSAKSKRFKTVRICIVAVSEGFRMAAQTIRAPPEKRPGMDAHGNLPVGNGTLGTCRSRKLKKN
jgi:hypothetical protein